MDLAQQWSSGVVGYLLVDGLVVRLRRVDSESLSRVGWAHLEGSEAYAAVATQQAQEQQAELLRGVAVQQGQDPAPVVAELERQARTKGVQRLVAMTATPEKEQALLERCDAYLCASVDGAAPHTYQGPPIVVRELAEAPEEWAPFQFVRAEGDAGPGKAHVGRLGRHTRTLAGLAVISLLQGVTRRRVEAFPAAAGPAGRAPRAREDVRRDAGEGAPVES